MYNNTPYAYCFPTRIVVAMCFGGIRISPGAFAVRLVSLPTEQYIKCACTSDIRRRRRRRSRKVAVVVHAPRCRRRHPPRHHPRTVAAAESIRPHKRARSHRPPKMASRRAHGGGRGSRLNYWTAVRGGHEHHVSAATVADKRFLPPTPPPHCRPLAEDQPAAAVTGRLWNSVPGLLPIEGTRFVRYSKRRHTNVLYSTVFNK